MLLWTRAKSSSLTLKLGTGTEQNTLIVTRDSDNSYGHILFLISDCFLRISWHEENSFADVRGSQIILKGGNEYPVVGNMVACKKYKNYPDAKVTIVAGKS